MIIKEPKPNSRWMLEQQLLHFGPYDCMTLGDAFENIAVFGGVGSGKTSGSGNAIVRALLANGHGGMVLTAKKGEAERFRKLCRSVGREDDLIVVDDKGSFQFNFLDFLLEVQGRRGSVVENIVAMLDAAMKVAERATGNKPARGQEQFWEQGIRKHARSVITTIIYATGSISVEHMLEVMRATPRSLTQVADPEWQREGLIPQLIARARATVTDEIAIHDLDQIEAYFTLEFPMIAEKTRSVFEAGLYGILDLFSRGTLYGMFGRGTNVSPKQCLDGKILVIDLPIATHRVIGLIAQTLFKLGFQQAAETRDRDNLRPIFLLADEFQELITVEDFRFASISRECRVVNIWLTQSIASLYTVLGGDEAGKAACDAILGLASTKIFHTNACPITNEWAAGLIGRRRIQLYSNSLSHPTSRVLGFMEDEPNATSSVSEHFEYAVMPHEFALLRKGGPMLFETDTIVYRSGRVWVASGDNYLRVTFKQELL